MTSRHSPKSYIAKAETALSEARILIRASAVNGPCNRAYYAMFYAAHAALFALGIEGLTRPIKTHRGLVARFGQDIILPGHLPRDFGNDLSKVEEIRLLADYSDDTIKMERAVWAVERAEAFVAAVKQKFGL
jgi:uncharacterized protein (UPF0332 family)